MVQLNVNGDPRVPDDEFRKAPPAPLDDPYPMRPRRNTARGWSMLAILVILIIAWFVGTQDEKREEDIRTERIEERGPLSSMEP